MSTLKISISLIAILCFILSSIDAEERIAYKKHWIFPSGSDLFFNPKSYRLSDEYHNLTYVLCDGYEDLHTNMRNCTVVQDTQPEKSCPLTLQTFRNGPYGSDYLEIFPFGSTKAVLVLPVYSKPRSIKITILDFTTCKIKDVLQRQNTHSLELAYFVAYDDSFELLINSDAQNNRHDKFHIDAEGNVISEFVPWNMPARVGGSSGYITFQFSSDLTYRAIPMDRKPAAYLHFGQSYMDFHVIQITLIRPDGSTIVLAEFHDIFIDMSNKAISTSHETIGIAIADENHVDVLLFDREGKLKLNTSVAYDIRVESDDLVYNLALRNLADGGFLLYANGAHSDADKYYLTKVDADGKVVGIVKNGPECDCEDRELGLQVFENEAKEYCVAIACGHNHDSWQDSKSAHYLLDLLVKCVSDEDFSKSNYTVV